MMTGIRVKRRYRLVTLAAAAVLLVSACGDDDDAGSSDTTEAPSDTAGATDTTAATDTTVAPDDGDAAPVPDGTPVLIAVDPRPDRSLARRPESPVQVIEAWAHTSTPTVASTGTRSRSTSATPGDAAVAQSLTEELLAQSRCCSSSIPHRDCSGRGARRGRGSCHGGGLQPGGLGWIHRGVEPAVQPGGRCASSRAAYRMRSRSPPRSVPSSTSR